MCKPIPNSDENCEFNVSTFCEYHEYRKALYRKGYDK